MGCLWYLVYVYWGQSTYRPNRLREPMSKTAALPLIPSASLFARFVTTLDRVLMASARAAVRNGDLPYFGL
jgi:hypothetical protein